MLLASSGGQGCCETFYNAHHRPQSKELLSPNAKSAEFGTLTYSMLVAQPYAL